MSDTDRWHEWTPSVTSVRRLDGGAFAVGSRALIRQPKFPPALWKITAIEPGRSFTWVSAAPGIRVIAHHWVEPANGGSRATLSLEYQGIIGGVLGRLTRDITKRYCVRGQRIEGPQREWTFTAGQGGGMGTNRSSISRIVVAISPAWSRWADRHRSRGRSGVARPLAQTPAQPDERF
jgi:hypothetical protein